MIDGPMAEVEDHWKEQFRLSFCTRRQRMMQC
jgi:hypothetical protein